MSQFDQQIHSYLQGYWYNSVFDYLPPVQIPYILNLVTLQGNVAVTELLPDAIHCFYNLVRSWFWLEKSDLKHKQCLQLLFDSQMRQELQEPNRLYILANKGKVYCP